MLICVFAMVYLMSEYCITKKIIDIYRNPSRYNKIPRYEEYLHSSWYWNPKKEYSKGDPPQKALLQVSWIGDVMILVYAFLQYAIRMISTDAETVYYIRGFYLSTISFISVLLLSAYFYLLAAYMQFYSTSPRAICFRVFHVFHKKGALQALKSISLIVLVANTLILPMTFLQLNNYAIVKKDQIIYSPYFTLEEQVFPYDNIINVESICNNKGIETNYYISNAEGDRFDLYDIETRNAEEIRSFIVMTISNRR